MRLFYPYTTFQTKHIHYIITFSTQNQTTDIQRYSFPGKENRHYMSNEYIFLCSFIYTETTKEDILHWTMKYIFVFRTTYLFLKRNVITLRANKPK